MNNWIKGLKEYNKNSDSWCIPKKGSKGYNNIMNKKKPTVNEQRQSLEFLSIDEYKTQAIKLGQEEMKKRGIYRKGLIFPK